MGVRFEQLALGEDDTGSGDEDGVGVSGRARTIGSPFCFGLQSDRLRVNHLRQQLGTATRVGCGRGERSRPGGVLRAVGQPEIRGTGD